MPAAGTSIITPDRHPLKKLAQGGVDKMVSIGLENGASGKPEAASCVHCGKVFNENSIRWKNVDEARVHQSVCDKRKCVDCGLVVLKKLLAGHQLKCKEHTGLPSPTGMVTEANDGFKCEHCGKLFGDKEDAREHAAAFCKPSNTSSRASLKCQHCDEVAPSEAAVLEHESTCFVRKCKYCSTTFNRKGIQSHERRCKHKVVRGADGEDSEQGGDEEDQVTMALTESKEASPSNSVRNAGGVAQAESSVPAATAAATAVAIAKGDLPNMTCEHCDQTYPNITRLKSHLCLMKKCEYCHERFFRKGIHPHQRSCRKKLGIDQPVAAESEESESEEGSEEEGSSEEGSSEEEEEKEEEEEEDEDVNVKRKGRWARGHADDESGESVDKGRKSNQQLVCRHCEREFSTIQQTRTHTSSCDDRRCKYCDKLFNKRGVNTHEAACMVINRESERPLRERKPPVQPVVPEKKSHHTKKGETLYPCRFCGREFGSRALGGHMGGCKRRFFALSKESQGKKRKHGHVSPARDREDRPESSPTRARGSINTELSPSKVVVMVQCNECGREVVKERIKFHLQSCERATTTPARDVAPVRGENFSKKARLTMMMYNDNCLLQLLANVASSQMGVDLVTC